jgi:hypothetical protein
MALIERATPWGRPQKNRVGASIFAFPQARREERGAEPGRSVGRYHVKTADVAVTLGFAHRIGELLDDLKPDHTHQALSVLSNPTAPRTSPAQPVSHPALAAPEEAGLGLRAGIELGAEGVPEAGQHRSVSRNGRPDGDAHRLAFQASSLRSAARSSGRVTMARPPSGARGHSSRGRSR